DQLFDWLIAKPAWAPRTTPMLRAAPGPGPAAAPAAPAVSVATAAAANRDRAARLRTALTSGPGEGGVRVEAILADLAPQGQSRASLSLARICSTAFVCIWQMRLSVTP